MKQTGCSQEETTGVARFVQSVAAAADAAAPPRDSPLPDASRVWHRAALAAERDKAERVRSAVEYVQIGLAAAAPIGLGGWVVWNWFGIEATAEQFLLGAWPQLSVATLALASLAPAALMLVALALGYPLLAGE